jgi:predicted NBD/HSP70 family sugar kinase
VLAPGEKEAVKIPSGPKMTASQMVREVKRSVAHSAYDVVSVGYPGPVVHGRPVHEPRNLGGGWVGFDFSKAFARPVKIINDAAMQAVGSYEGGRMLFLGFGTGLGSAMIADGRLAPMELAHLPYKKGKSYEEFVGLRALEHMGKKKWRKEVQRVVVHFMQVLQADYAVLGGGNAKKLKKLPPHSRLGDNSNAFLGGLRLWGKLSKDLGV